MKTFYEVKTVDNSVKDVDEKTRRVVNVLSEMGSKDLDNEVMDHGAYNKTIRERGPKAKNLVWHLTDHYPTMKNAVAKFSDLYVEGNKLIGVTDIPNTSWGNDVLEFYAKGHINQHSVGFRTIKAEPVDAGNPGEYRLIKEVLLYEASSVLWAAHPSTPNLTVGKSLTKEEAADEYGKLFDRQNMLLKSLRDGRFTDDTFELIEMESAQIQERLKQLFIHINTQPVVTTVEPEEATLKEPVEDVKSMCNYLLTLN
jgi:uncharacterized protein